MKRVRDGNLDLHALPPPPSTSTLTLSCGHVGSIVYNVHAPHYECRQCNIRDVVAITVYLTPVDDSSNPTVFIDPVSLEPIPADNAYALSCGHAFSTATLAKLKKKSDGWYYFPCPLCRRPSFGMIALTLPPTMQAERSHPTIDGPEKTRQSPPRFLSKDIEHSYGYGRKCKSMANMVQWINSTLQAMFETAMFCWLPLFRQAIVMKMLTGGYITLKPTISLRIFMHAAGIDNLCDLVSVLTRSNFAYENYFASTENFRVITNVVTSDNYILTPVELMDTSFCVEHARVSVDIDLDHELVNVSSSPAPSCTK